MVIAVIRTGKFPTLQGSGGQGGVHIPKTQGLKCCGWGPRPCNTENARGE